MADPDLELREGGGGLDLLALLVFFPSVISSFFAQNKGGPPVIDHTFRHNIVKVAVDPRGDS